MSAKILFAVVPFFVLACGGSGDDDSAKSGSGGSSGTSAGTGGSTSGSGGSGATGGSTSGSGGRSNAQCASGMLTLSESSNYSFASNITLKPITMKPKEPGLTFDWSGLTTDFLGRTTSPTKDIDSVLVAVLHLTVADFQKHVNDDDGGLTATNAGALQLRTQEMLTSGNMKDFGPPGQPQTTYNTSESVKATVDDYLDPAVEDPSQYIYAVMPSTGTNPGAGSRMIQLFTLDAASTNTSITFVGNTRTAPGMGGHTGGTTGPSMDVTYDANLHQLTPIKIAAGSTNLTIDWTMLTKNGLGRPWVSRSLYKLIVGHYTQSLTELENQFLDLETIATTLYSEDLPDDNPISLSGLKDSKGAAFTGIDNTGTWIMALFCDPRNCGNPAPWYLTVLQTCN